MLVRVKEAQNGIEEEEFECQLTLKLYCKLIVFLVCSSAKWRHK